MGFNPKNAKINKMKTLRIITLFSLILPLTSRAQLDLHAHLDLKPGVGPLLRGDFKSPPVAYEWNSRLSTKAAESTLLHFKTPRLIVVSFYSHPILSDVRQGADEEYSHILKFTRDHADHYAIAKNAKEAQTLLASGKSVFVLSIEGAADLLETEEDFKKWIDQRGVAIVTPFHLTEDHFGGTALMGEGFIGFVNSPLDFLRSLWVSGGSCIKSICKSTIGIKPDGRILIDRLIQRKVWIDLAHSNDIEVQDILRDYERLKLPVLVTHTEVREVLLAERASAPQVWEYLAQNDGAHDGIVGLLPTSDMIREDLGGLKGEPCYSSLEAFKRVVLNQAKKYGEEHITLGSDINAPINGLSPSCARTIGAAGAHSALEVDGYYSYSQWDELENYVSPSSNWNESSRKHFLKLWERVHPSP